MYEVNPIYENRTNDRNLKNIYKGKSTALITFEPSDFFKSPEFKWDMQILFLLILVGNV